MLLIITECLVRNFSWCIIPHKDLTVLDAKSFISEKHQKYYEGILLGDSRAFFVDMNAISESALKATGRKFNFYKLSMPHSDIRSYYLMLRKYLSHNKAPEVILFSTMPASVFDGWDIAKGIGYNSVTHTFCLLFSIKDFFEVLPIRSIMQIITPEIEHSFFLITYRSYLNAFSFNHCKAGKIVKNKLVMHNEFDRRLLFAPEKSIKLDVFPFKQSILVDKDSLWWYKRFLELAKEHKIKVVQFNTPLTDSLYEHRQGNGFNACYKRLLDDLQSEFNNFTVLSPVLTSYNETLFFDYYHLNVEGFNIFNKELSASIYLYFTNQRHRF